LKVFEAKIMLLHQSAKAPEDRFEWISWLMVVSSKLTGVSSAVGESRSGVLWLWLKSSSCCSIYFSMVFSLDSVSELDYFSRGVSVKVP